MLHNEYSGKIRSRELSDVLMLRPGQGNVAKKLFFGDKTNRAMLVQYIEYKVFPLIVRQKHETVLPTSDFEDKENISCRRYKLYNWCR